jgi:hypothetical protein
MDNYRPTIVVSEMVGNRTDCGSRYQMVCSLGVNEDVPERDQYDGHFVQGNWHDGEFHDEHGDTDGHSVGVWIKLQFAQWHGEEILFQIYLNIFTWILFYASKVVIY